MDDYDVVLELARTKEADDPYAMKLSPQYYNLRSASASYERAELSWDEELVAAIESLRSPRPDPELLRRIGDVLRAFLKPTGWALHESALLAAAEAERRVIFTIRSAAAELYFLPWELLTLGQTMQHLGERPNVLVRYEWPGAGMVTAKEKPSPRPEGGRILFAHSQAAGRVPIAEHLAAIQDACEEAHHPFDPDHDVIASASLAKLEGALQEARQQDKPIAVIHLLCHGGPVGSTFGLMLDAGAEDGPPGVDAASLSKLLQKYAEMVRLVVIAACDSGNAGRLGNHMGSVAQALHRAGVAAVVASRFPLSIKGSNEFARVFYRELLVPPRSVEDAFIAARQRLTAMGDARRIDWASVQLYARADDGSDTRPVVVRPYQGLLPLTRDHDRLFFGREQEAQEIVSKLGALERNGQPRLLVVQGWSGTGKSSMVMAGAVPRLIRPRDPGAGGPGDPGSGPGLVLATMKPGRDPLTGLDRELIDREKRRPALLIVDQFEEIFTHADEANRTAFCRKLWELASDPASGVLVLLTLRSDFIGRCGEILLGETGKRLDAVANAEAHSVRVSQLSAEQLRETIEKPAAKVGLVIDASLVQRILREIGTALGALPLIAHTMSLLWIERSGRHLTMEAYERIGTVTGALHRHANALIASLDERARPMAERLFVGLVSQEIDSHATAAAGRRRLTVQELSDGLCHGDVERQRSFDEMLGTLERGRLLVTEGEGGRRTVEVAHEALIRGWTQLDEWLERHGEMARRKKELDRWIAMHRSLGTLLNERQIAAVESFKNDFPDALSPDAARLLEASRAKVAAARRRARIALAASVVTAVVMGALAIGAYLKKQEAEGARAAALEAKAEAEQQAMRAADASLIAGAQERMVRQDPLAAMQLLRYVKQPGRQKNWLRLALETLKSSPAGVLKGHKGAVNDVAFSAGGRWIATGSEDGTARVWNVETPETKFEMVGHSAAVTSVAFSRDEDAEWIATGSADRTARVWNTRNPRDSRLLQHEDAVTQVRFSAHGDLLTLSKGGQAWLWRHTGHNAGTEPARADAIGSGAVITAAAFDPRGEHIITAAKDGTARIWSAQDLRPEGVIHVHKPLMTAAIAPESHRAVTITEQDEIDIWDIKGSAPKLLPRAPIDPAKDASSGRVSVSAFSLSDSGMLVLGYRDGAAFVADIRGEGPAEYKALKARPDPMGGRASFDRKAHSTAVVRAAYNPLSMLVLTASTDGIARVWSNAAIRNNRQSMLVLPASADRIVRAQASSSEYVEVSIMRHSDEIRAAELSPDGQMIVTGSRDKAAHLWKAERNDEITLPASVSDLSFTRTSWLAVLRGSPSPDPSLGPGYAILIAPKERSIVLLFDPSSSEESRAAGLSLAAISQDGNVVAGVLKDRRVRIWRREDAAEGQRQAKANARPFILPDPQDERITTPLSLTADGSRVLVVSEGRAGLYPTRAPATPVLFEGHGGKIAGATLSADGKWFVAGSDDGAAYLWSVGAPARPDRRLKDEKDVKAPISSVAFSRSGERILAVSDRGVGRIWSTRAQQPDGACLGDSSQACTFGLRKAALSADGTWIAAVLQDGSAQVWRVDALDKPMPLAERGALSVAFDEGSERVAVGSGNGRARIWRLKDRQVVIDLGSQAAAVDSVAFSLDGENVVTASKSGESQLWLIDTQKVREKIERATLDCLPEEQLQVYLDGTGLDASAFHCERGDAIVH